MRRQGRKYREAPLHKGAREAVNKGDGEMSVGEGRLAVEGREDSGGADKGIDDVDSGKGGGDDLRSLANRRWDWQERAGSERQNGCEQWGGSYTQG